MAWEDYLNLDDWALPDYTPYEFANPFEGATYQNQKGFGQLGWTGPEAGATSLQDVYAASDLGSQYASGAPIYQGEPEQQAYTNLFAPAETQLLGTTKTGIQNVWNAAKGQFELAMGPSGTIPLAWEQAYEQYGPAGVQNIEDIFAIGPEATYGPAGSQITQAGEIYSNIAGDIAEEKTELEDQKAIDEETTELDPA